MKPFVIWFMLTLLVFGISSGTYHWYLKTHPQKILVAVDTSFLMQSVWQQVPQVLQDIADQRYATFSLVTERSRIHSWSPELKLGPIVSWSPELKLGPIVPYGPRDFSKFTSSTKYAEIDEATKKYLITTNLEAPQRSNFKGWTIIQLSP
jgi:hypothetical protein